MPVSNFHINGGHDEPEVAKYTTQTYFLGHLTSLDPYTVQLDFEPAGRPGTEDYYYLNFKDNVCVVCGSDESYMRKNVVPHDYRRHFPLVMKDHHSHDILLTCPKCHCLANHHDDQLRKELAIKYNAPLGNAAVCRLVEDPVLRKVKSAARALNYAGNKIPEDRHQELSIIVQKYFNAPVLTQEIIMQAAAMETQPDEMTRTHLGEFTNELNYQQFIREFCSGGPKNYGYLCNDGKTECKVKGHSLNVEGRAQLNYQVSRQKTLDELSRPFGTPRKTVIHEARKIVRRCKEHSLHTHPTQKNYQLVYNKRVPRPGTSITYPYGYRLTEEDSFTDDRRGFTSVLHDDELAQLLLGLDEEKLRLWLHPEDKFVGCTCGAPTFVCGLSRDTNEVR
ncbi:uncharacterized protein [Montipora foliosa]|uniref:uncharacterized protein n=1 Tax=Montipora foliosa TaxID=591990 RepID=UPI0035F1E505